MNIDSDLYFDVIIIGGGFFGCSLAIYLRQRFKRVLVIEMADDLLQRASYINQARVHNGYHYPRSILTALRSRVNFPRFVDDYSECIDRNFTQYYAIGKNFSKVSAAQFRLFMERIGAEIMPASKDIRKLTNHELIEDIYEVREYAFDAIKLKDHIWRDLKQTGVVVWLKKKVVSLEGILNGKILLTCVDSNPKDSETKPIILIASNVYNCTYAHLNQVLIDSNSPGILLKHELTEMAVIELPEELRGIGITVMCGPFFSFMPFPCLGASTLSHVRYTPHNYWMDGKDSYFDGYDYLARVERKSNYPYMIRDAKRFVPALAKSRYIDSLWEIKTTLPQSEVDDSRPILMLKNYRIPNLTYVMGGKIDNIYDVIAELQ